MIAAFSDDAIVEDEVHEYRGTEAIRGWMNWTIVEYQTHFEIRDLDTNGESVTVHREVSGTFPGSPIPMQFQFTLAEDKITSLRIAG